MNELSLPWVKWLAELRELPAQAEQWHDVEAFLDEVRILADDKAEERAITHREIQAFSDALESVRKQRDT